jgi:hypothetical protein
LCEFYKETSDDRPYKSIYFTSRFELGHFSVYDKLKATHNILKASNMDLLTDAEKKFEDYYHQ